MKKINVFCVLVLALMLIDLVVDLFLPRAIELWY